MKEYFPHDYNARNDPKIENLLMEHGVAGIGVFWCIVEMLYEQEGKIPLAKTKAIAFTLHVEHSLVLSVINDFELFETDDVNFWSDAINRRLSARNNVSEQRRKAVEQRWKKAKEKNNESHTNVSPPDTSVIHGSYESNTIKEKKRKEEYILDSSLHSESLSENKISDDEENEENKLFREKSEKERLILEEVRNFYNKKILEHNSRLPRAQSKFSNKRKSATLARVKEYGIDVVKTVIEKSCLSSHMNGKNGWTASYDWIMLPNNFPKILDGNYDDAKASGYSVGVNITKDPDKYKNMKGAWN